MRLWQFLKQESGVNVPRLTAFIAVSGLSNSLVLAIINAAAQQTSSKSRSDGGSPLLFVAFVLTLSLYIVTQRYILRTSNASIDAVIGKLRIRLADKIRRADLMPLDLLGRDRIYSVIARDTQTISQATSPTVTAIQSAVMILFTMIYIASMRMSAFLITAVVIAVGVLIHVQRNGQITRDFQEAAFKENEYFRSMTHLLEGFKEVKLNRNRSNDLFSDMRSIANSVTELKTRTSKLFADYFIMTQTIFFSLLALMVFILPRSAKDGYSSEVTRITAAILFIIGPLMSVVATIPIFTAAEIAVGNLQALEADIDLIDNASVDEEMSVPVPPESFHDLTFRDVRFAYRDHRGDSTFQVGPFDLTIKSEEILFIVGGNGSGKSTFLKLLTALYYPDSGEILLDGKNIKEVGFDAYRGLFSAIFTDYHLFDRLLGLGEVRSETVTAKLEDMRIADKTKFIDGRFINQELSTGQRKRIALIVSLLEDRKIYLFDEWAADQDPQFREVFYTSILPELRAQHKTIIAATHDDRFFHMADRVLKMENGQFSVVKKKTRTK